jgi:DNA polymerase-3 subunit beta
MLKGGEATEQLNIEGKRSGEGFVAHKAILVNALSRALAARVTLLDISVGRKGLLNYLKALGGSNIVKVIPSNGSASEAQTTVKRLKVICGANTSYLADNEWVKEGTVTKKSLRGGTPFTFCEVRICPKNTVKPNLGAIELAEALARTLPFTAKDEARPILGCVKFEAKDGKLRLVSADGFRLAVVSLDYEGEGEALISHDELKGMVNALKRARRIALGFENGGERLDSKSLILDTELIRYKWASVDGSYPDIEKVMPTEFNALAHFDTNEATKALNSLKALADSKAYPIDLTTGNGKMIMANPDGKGQAEVNADIEGEGKIRIDGKYLAEVLKACGGMVELKLVNASSPMLFSVDGYQVVVMPMMTEYAKEQQAKAKAEVVAEAEAVAGAVTQAEAVVQKPKRKRQPKREAVAVA